MWSPEKSGKRTVSPNGEKSLAALASVMLVPLPPKSHSTITPCVGRPGLARNAVSAAVASDTTGGSPACAQCLRRVSTTDGRQCAGTVTATSDTGAPLAALRANAVERFGQQISGPVLGAVLGDHRDGIADAVDEPGKRQTPLQRHRCRANDRSLSVAGACKVGGPNGQAKRIALAALRIRHVTPLRQVGHERLARP